MRQRIIEGALKIFIHQGIRATTMDDVAKQLGISKRTIYEHFRDKKELLQMVVEHAHTLTKNGDRAIFDSAGSALEGFLMLMKKKRSDMNVRMMKTVVELSRYYPDIIEEMRRKHADEGLKTLETTIARGIEEGVFRHDLNTKTSAYIFSSQANLLFSEQMSRMDLYSIDSPDISAMHVFQDLFLNFLRGISTPKGIQIIEQYEL
jgi:AcrR family transcriptional regulator